MAFKTKNVMFSYYMNLNLTLLSFFFPSFIIPTGIILPNICNKARIVKTSTQLPKKLRKNLRLHN